MKINLGPVEQDEDELSSGGSTMLDEYIINKKYQEAANNARNKDIDTMYDDLINSTEAMKAINHPDVGFEPLQGTFTSGHVRQPSEELTIGHDYQPIQTEPDHGAGGSLVMGHEYPAMRSSFSNYTSRLDNRPGVDGPSHTNRLDDQLGDKQVWLKDSHKAWKEHFVNRLQQDTRFTLSKEQQAYILATVEHETAGTFKAIKEYKAKVGTRAAKLQSKYWDNGYYGRGYVQLTHKYNYARMGEILGVDLVNNPDLALKPDISYRILVEGMMRGSFTGARLSKYVNDNKADFYNARRVINGTDKAEHIANLANKWLAKL